MNLNSILDQAWDFLEESLKQKQANAKLENDRLTQLGLEQEKTKRMNMSSQERIQNLMNKGLLDKQELVNSGAMSVQQLQNSGLMDKAELDGQNKLEGQRLMNTGAVNVEKERGAWDHKRTMLDAETDLKIEASKSKTAREKSNFILNEYGDDGAVIGQKLANPYTTAVGRPAPEEVDNDDQIDRLYGPKKENATSSPGSTQSPISGNMSDMGRHTTHRTLRQTTDHPGISNPVLGKTPLAGSYEDRKKRSFNQPQRRVFS
jgi:hypothetical protein